MTGSAIFLLAILGMAAMASRRLRLLPTSVAAALILLLSVIGILGGFG